MLWVIAAIAASSRWIQRFVSGRPCWSAVLCSMKGNFGPSISAFQPGMRALIASTSSSSMQWRWWRRWQYCTACIALIISGESTNISHSWPRLLTPTA